MSSKFSNFQKEKKNQIVTTKIKIKKWLNLSLTENYNGCKNGSGGGGVLKTKKN